MLGCELGTGIVGKGSLDCIGDTTHPLGPIGDKGYAPTVIGRVSGEETDAGVPIMDVEAVYHPKMDCTMALKEWAATPDSASGLAASAVTAGVATALSTFIL